MVGTSGEQIEFLEKKVRESEVPTDLSETVVKRLDELSRLSDSPTFLPELDHLGRYVDWIVSIPWNKKTTDNLDLNHARNILDESHYGLARIKDRILEYMSVMSLTQEGKVMDTQVHAPILCFVGLVGTGKTTVSKSIAAALGRKFARIPFGGMGDPLDLRGKSRMHAETEPGKVIKALRSTQSMNPVILLDEIDRVTDEGRASIMGVLVELLDPEQNHAFVDHYIDYPVNLSEVMFIATANNTHHIATAVLDRLEPIGMPSYSDEEKIKIAKDYMLPKILKESGIGEGVIIINDDAWGKITRPLGYDAGIRTLERTIEGMVRKIARMIVEGKGQNFEVNAENIKQFLPQ